MFGRPVKANTIANSHNQKGMGDTQVDQHICTAHGDVLASEAIGDNIPPGYFTSSYFLGTAVVR